jgi:hypothetical protein
MTPVQENGCLRRRTAALFAADCAEHVLPIFEAAYGADDRPRKAIEVARSDGFAGLTPDGQNREAMTSSLILLGRSADDFDNRHARFNGRV